MRLSLAAWPALSRSVPRAATVDPAHRLVQSSGCDGRLTRGRQRSPQFRLYVIRDTLIYHGGSAILEVVDHVRALAHQYDVRQRPRSSSSASPLSATTSRPVTPRTPSPGIAGAAGGSTSPTRVPTSTASSPSAWPSNARNSNLSPWNSWDRSSGPSPQIAPLGPRRCASYSE